LRGWRRLRTAATEYAAAATATKIVMAPGKTGGAVRVAAFCRESKIQQYTKAWTRAM